MTNKAAVITASLVDVRNVAQHKCVRLEVHVPVEQAGEVMAAFGWPTMVDPVPVELARLDLSAAKPPNPKIESSEERDLRKFREDRARTELGPDTRGLMNVGLEHIAHEEAQKPKRRMSELPVPQQAALLCNREAFWRFLTDKSYVMPCRGEDDAAAFVRALCGVESRADLAEREQARERFHDLQDEFNDWLRMP